MGITLPAPLGLRRAAVRIWLAVASALALVIALAPVQAAQAVEVPSGLEIEQRQGFATLTWDPVEGATTYEIERTLMDGDEPAGEGLLVGRWVPDRHIDATGQPTGDLTFADSGFTLGETYSWRIRAVSGEEVGEWSAPVVDETQAHLGPQEFRTGFELSDGAAWTTHEDEVEVVEAIAAASDRVNLQTIGETYEGRPLHLATLGYPEPRSAEEIADSPTAYIACTVHGNERSGREGCLILLRELAFSDDPWVTELLSEVTVLITPTENPDGQAVGRRTNSAGQDQNRDHILLRHPEAVAVAETIRDYQPDVIVDAHEMGSGADTAPMWSRSRIVNEELWALGQNDLTLGWLFDAGHDSGFELSPYAGWANNNWEGWLHNVAGLKNTVGQLFETPTQSGFSRPNSPNGSPANQQRRVYTQLWSFHSTLDYYQNNIAEVQDAIAASKAQHSANEGPIYLDGAYDPPFDPPRLEPVTSVLEQPVCGYRLSPEQYQITDSGELIGAVAGQRWESGTIEERLAMHGVQVEEIGGGIVDVPLAQPLRGLIPYMLDPELDTDARPIGTPNLGMLEDAERLDDSRESVVVGDVETTVANRVDDLGCSVNDKIADEQDWPTRGAFVRHANSVVQELVADGQVSYREGAQIRQAAARSDVGR